MGKRDKPCLPKGWPASVRYITSPIYSSQLTKAELVAIRTYPTSVSGSTEGTDSLRGIESGPSAKVRITPINDPLHPAHGQNGLFAARDLKPGEVIVAYLGEVHPGGRDGSDEGHAMSDYDLWLDRNAGVAVDAARSGNEARFINDYRGVPGLVQKRPNAEFRTVWDDGRGEMVMAVSVLPAGKKAIGRARTVGIAKGQEILVSYGKGFWRERTKEAELGD